MKLLKIGSDSSCDIVINSDYVSSYHADLTLLDNGDIIIEDKNSTNGTFVGKKKINPNQEVPVRRGDLVKFADENLVWARVPSLPNNSQYKNIVNIGSNYRNNIVINNQAVSRYHAALKITKGGKAFLVDNGSKNGTQVNGMKITPGKPVQVKRGDNIICGGEDITDQLAMFLKPTIGITAIKGFIAAAAVALLVGIGYLIYSLIGGTVNPNDYLNSVVYVRAAYHYEVKLKDNPLSDQNKHYLIISTRPQPYQATAFFLDQYGRLGTNRHVAVPWAEEYRSKDNATLRQEYSKWLVDELQVFDIDLGSSSSMRRAIQRLQQTNLGQILLDESSDWNDLKAKIERIRKSEIVIEGAIDFITVGYPGQNYTHEDDFERCFVVKESGSKDVDLAILQLNKKKTPSAVKKTIDPTKFFSGVIKPLNEQLFVIGYPNGLDWAMNETTHSLEPQVKESKVSKTPDKYNFEFNSSSVGGSSGSPIITDKGQLMGVLCSGYVGTSVTYAVLAKYLRDMYLEEIGSLSQTAN